MTLADRWRWTPRRARLALDVFTALVIVSIAFALAGVTWRLAGHAGTGAITVPAKPRPVPVPDLAPALALAPFGRATGIADDAQPTALALVLKGIVFARPATLSSAFIANGGETPRPFRIGEALAGATIEGITPTRVILRNNGRAEYLAFPNPAASPSPAAPGVGVSIVAPAPPVPAYTPQPTSGAAAAQFIQQLGAEPTANGYRIGENAPPGLRQGDVLQSLNGDRLTGPDAARDAFARARQTGTAQVQVVRDGKPVTLTIPIR